MTQPLFLEGSSVPQVGSLCPSPLCALLQLFPLPVPPPRTVPTHMHALPACSPWLPWAGSWCQAPFLRKPEPGTSLIPPRPPSTPPPAPRDTQSPALCTSLYLGGYSPEPGCLLSPKPWVPPPCIHACPLLSCVSFADLVSSLCSGNFQSFQLPPGQGHSPGPHPPSL